MLPLSADRACQRHRIKSGTQASGAYLRPFLHRTWDATAPGPLAGRRCASGSRAAGHRECVGRRSRYWTRAPHPRRSPPPSPATRSRPCVRAPQHHRCCVHRPAGGDGLSPACRGDRTSPARRRRARPTCARSSTRAAGHRQRPGLLVGGAHLQWTCAGGAVDAGTGSAQTPGGRGLLRLVEIGDCFISVVEPPAGELRVDRIGGDHRFEVVGISTADTPPTNTPAAWHPAITPPGSAKYDSHTNMCRR